MKRWLVVVVALVAGFVTGGVAAGVAQRPPAREAVVPAVEDEPPPEPPEPPDDGGGLLLAWGRSLPPATAGPVRALAGVEDVTVVRGDLVHLVATWDAGGAPVDALPAGHVFPLDALAVDRSYAGVLGDPALSVFDDLGPGEAVLGATSAGVRRLAVGGRLELAGGARFTVAAIVDDALVGGAEVVLSEEGGRAAGVTTPRALLVAHDAERVALERGIRTAVDGAAGDRVPLKFRAAGETAFLRHGDGVLPQALIKERFGEFSYVPADGTVFVQDGTWNREHTVAAELPLVGRLRCHRSVLPALEGAIRELQQRNLGWLISSFQGCFNPRLTGDGRNVSRHAWGVAVDVNYGKNLSGRSSAQDPRLVEVMERWGFTWGGRWLVPDPAHFEYLRPAKVDA